MGPRAVALKPGGPRRASLQQVGNDFRGEVTLHVLEADKLSMDVKRGQVAKPFARVVVDGTAHDTGPAIGSYVHMWKNASFKIPVLGPKTVQIELHHRTGADNSAHIGAADITVQYANDCGDAWLQLVNKTGDATGQVKVRWSFEAGAGPAMDEPPQVEGTAQLEIIRIKDLVCPENWVSYSMYVEAEYRGEVVATTGAQKRNDNPYYNTRFDLPVLTGSREVDFRVWDENLLSSGEAPADANPRRLFAAARLILPDLTTLMMKPDIQLFPLRFVGDDADADTAAADALAAGADGAKDGEMYVKLQYKASDAAAKARAKKKSLEGTVVYDAKRRRSTLNPNGTISLDYEPKLDGSVSLVPEATTYCWIQFLDGAKEKWAKDLENLIIQGYLQELIAAAATAPTARMRQRTSRSSSTAGPRNEALNHANPTAGGGRGRSRSQAEIDPPTMDTVIEKKWLFQRLRPIFDMVKLCADRRVLGESVVVPEGELHAERVRLTERSIMRFEVARASDAVKEALAGLWQVLTENNEGSDDDRRLEELRYKAICAQYFSRFCPSVSGDLAERLVEAEWREEGASGRDHEGRVLMHDERFAHLMMVVASVWCDTLTEAELVRFISNSAGVVEAAEKAVAKLRKTLPSSTFAPRPTSSGVRAPRRPTTPGRKGSTSTPRKHSKPKTTPRNSIASLTSPPPDSVISPSSTNGPDDDAPDFADFTYRTMGSDLGGTYNSRVSNADAGRRRSKAGRKASTASGAGTPTKRSSNSRRGSRAKQKSPFEIAEAKVHYAFDMEDMEWKVMASWAKDLFGGFGDSARDLLDLGPNEVRSCMLRLYPDFPKKHPKIQSDLVAAVCEFFAAIKPKPKVIEPSVAMVGSAESASLQAKRIGSKVNVEAFDRILSYCDVHTLRCMVSLNQYCCSLVTDMLERRVGVSYPLPEPDMVSPTYMTSIFTEAQCKELAREISLGKMRSPSRLVIALSEMACALVGVETNGYWAKFREFISKPTCHATTFAEFIPKDMTYEKFARCRAIKLDNDYGRDKNGTHQLSRDLLGVSWFTMSEHSILKTTGSQNLLALYRWVKTLMSVYSRQAGRVDHYVQEYGWRDPLGMEDHIFWN
eukprot:TRINITY_DN16242_c0_g1_i1.p1 TRINITY_DN16242_c0_g1~~TRINITY_DN16242_c0_g1_i1.p1  ORF type:complete len:1142 (+),score=330.84 TRINITY_DN16242_c0_g1_i1:104-3427(+)